MSQIGLGTKVEINDGTASAFVAVSNFVHLKPPNEEVSKVDSKRLDLTARTLTYVQGLQVPGEFTYEYEFTSAEYARHEGLRRDGTTNKSVPKSFKITIVEDTANTVKTVPGFITKNEIGQISADEIVMATVTVCVTGPAS